MFCAPPKALRNLLPRADHVLARGSALSRLRAAVPPLLGTEGLHPVSSVWYLVFCVGGSPGGSSSGTLQGDRRPTLQQSRILREGAFRHTRGMCVS